MLNKKTGPRDLEYKHKGNNKEGGAKWGDQRKKMLLWPLLVLKFSYS